MNEIKAIETIDNALSSLDADERARVLGWTNQKYGTSTGTVRMPVHSTSSGGQVDPENPSAPVSKGPKSRVSKKSKSVISMDKGLNLNPAGKVSAAEFATAKAPSNALQKSVVAVYYLRETIGLSKVTVESVYTVFKTLSWPVPADLKNALQKAGTQGWLDTADSNDIKLTSSGENLVEHGLPPKAKAK
ncbi:MAG: hypothetical protein EON90_07850 [Brevundimonas sp.]|nr:MAG: hypothetical protein EON90_07850 [Brevundimonas sp.]